MILAIDTSSASSSVALVRDGRVIAERQHIDARRHAEVLAGLVEEVLDGTRPDLIAVGVGPGPYTGVRVGVTTAQVLGLAWGVPVHGICSLDALASEAAQLGMPSDFAVATDARRREVYWARYGADGRRLAGPYVTAPTVIPDAERALPWVGEGALLHPDALVPWPSTEHLRHVQARWIAAVLADALAAGEAPMPPVAELARHGEDDGSTAQQLAGHRLPAPYPLYVRRPDAAEPVTA